MSPIIVVWLVIMFDIMWIIQYESKNIFKELMGKEYILALCVYDYTSTKALDYPVFRR